MPGRGHYPGREVSPFTRPIGLVPAVRTVAVRSVETANVLARPMTDEEKLDENAIRAQLDKSLENMQAPLTEPTDASEDDAAGTPESGSSKKSRLPTGTVTAIDGNQVFVELGPRTQGVASIDEFDEPPQVGQQYEFSLVSIQDNLWTLSRREARTLATWKNLEPGRPVKATVIGVNSGGLEMKVGPVSAFMPASEVGTARVEDLTALVGETWVCEVLEVVKRRKRVVISRRRVLERERREARERTIETLKEGQVVRGKVEKLEPFGAFVDIGGGVTGLLHVSNISHTRVADPSNVLEVGQVVEVQVLEIKEGGKRIGLGMKQLQPDPWERAAERFRPGNVVKGRVVRVAEFGAFVELEPGIEGLCHKSQLATERINRVEDAVKVGEEVAVRVMSFEAGNRRIALSRLSERGHMIGSDEDLGGEDIDRYIDRGRTGSGGTNLGALLREAMEKAEREKKSRGS